MVDRSSFIRLALIATTFAALSSGAQAQEFTLGAYRTNYPALVSQTGGIDPNTYIVGPASSLTVRAGHANFEHPALAMRAAPTTIDGNTFIVQHPAAQTWLSAQAPAESPLLALTSR